MSRLDRISDTPTLNDIVVRMTAADRDWMVQVIEALVEAIDGLLDGLDANVDGRDGLSSRLWELRIKDARLALALLEE